jgi:hypothetical protein
MAPRTAAYRKRGDGFLRCNRVTWRLLSCNGALISVFYMLRGGAYGSIPFIFAYVWGPFLKTWLNSGAGPEHILDGALATNFWASVAITAFVLGSVLVILESPRLYWATKQQVHRENRGLFRFMMHGGDPVTHRMCADHEMRRGTHDPYSNTHQWDYFSDEDPVEAANYFKDEDRIAARQSIGYLLQRMFYTRLAPHYDAIDPKYAQLRREAGKSKIDPPTEFALSTIPTSISYVPKEYAPKDVNA